VNIAIVVLALTALAAGLITAGVYIVAGAAGALIIAGLFVMVAAVRLQKVMAPNG
jgi:hypothetical protein